MPTTTNLLGANSQVITYGPNSTVTEMLSAIDAVLTGQGWSLHDANAGTNAKCYKALNADGSSYKYLLIDLNSTQSAQSVTCTNLKTVVYENWNASTHVGTNLANASDQAVYCQLLSLTAGGNLYVFANARYCAFFSKLYNGYFGSTTFGSFSGCFEVSRDNSEETPGQYPLFGFVTGGLCLGGSVSVGNGGHCFSPPRSVFSETGSQASASASLTTVFGSSISTASLRLIDVLPQGPNVMSPSGNHFVFTPYLADMRADLTKRHLRGRLFGLKIMAKQVGSAMDNLTMRVDNNLFFDPQAAVTADHFVLTDNLNGRYALPV